MPDYASSVLAVVDSRVAAGQTRNTKMGTVAARSPGALAGDPGAYWASVVFDGSSGTAQPVKCFESVIVAPGDRVGLVKYEGEWIITGNYTLRTLADVAMHTQLIVGTTTSATLVDVPSSPSLTLTKVRDATLLRIGLTISMYNVTATASVEMAVSVVSFDASTNYDEILFIQNLSVIGDRRNFTGWTTTAALPGNMGYTITGRWRRNTGSGTLSVDTFDAISISVREVVE